MSMDKRNYIKEYEKHSGLFKKHFGEKADIYWKMYLNYHVDHISYDKLGILHNISKTTVRYILKRRSLPGIWFIPVRLTNCLTVNLADFRIVH